MNDTATSSPETLRARMVDHIQHGFWPACERVADAMRTVPRHLFVPDATLEEAYDDQSVITKRDATGAALSCASTPAIVAMMLDQLDIQPGQRILEIGAGTGYNAALLAHLTGPNGYVTTVDIDPNITGGARRGGWQQWLPARPRRHPRRRPRRHRTHPIPYDRLIVTVGAWDLPAPWWTQLAPGGRLVAPLRWRGQTQSVAFTYDGAQMISDSMGLCGFVPMLGQDGEHTGYVDPDGHVSLYWDEDQNIDTTGLLGICTQPKAATWSGVTVRGEEPFDRIWLHLSATEPGTCRIAADKTATTSGLCTPAVGIRSPAIAENASLAYLTTPPAPGRRRRTLRTRSDRPRHCRSRSR
ncbi:methyltransferase, FxLD system [Fodinicola feengrottensis]|uniref:methyltransferase, FxLD system n=1 Tax=Fodinicola feengrottensis TaxID=435914 RepID=UPI0013D7DC18|nr:methyltransferase, FxLD system [Fodinicola feengrottensis]